MINTNDAELNGPVQEKAAEQAELTPAELTPEEFEAKLQALREAMQVGERPTDFVPPQLLAAAESLDELAREQIDGFRDYFGTDTAQSWRATCAAMEACRMMLSEIEHFAYRALASEFQYHQRHVAEIASLGIAELDEMELEDHETLR